MFRFWFHPIIVKRITVYGFNVQLGTSTYAGASDRAKQFFKSVPLPLPRRQNRSAATDARPRPRGTRSIPPHTRCTCQPAMTTVGRLRGRVQKWSPVIRIHVRARTDVRSYVFFTYDRHYRRLLRRSRSTRSSSTVGPSAPSRTPGVSIYAYRSCVPVVSYLDTLKT